MPNKPSGQSLVAPCLLLLLAGCGAAIEPGSAGSLPEAAGAGQVWTHRGAAAEPGDAALKAAAPAGAHLTYYGGRVVSGMRVVQVMWGRGSYLPNVSSTSSPSIATFYQGVLNSAYVDWLSEYNTKTQSIGRGRFDGQYTITPSTSATTVDDSVIRSELAAQVAAGKLPAPAVDANGNPATYYAVFFPHGTVITQGGTSSCRAGGFCAYHGTLSPSGSRGEAYYGVHPDMQAGSGCDLGCGGGSNTFANQTSVASHEMVETLTDPEVGLATVLGPPLGWYDTANGEIGDICNAQQGTVTGSDGVSYTVQAEFSNASNACIVSKAASVTLTATPAAVTVAAGATATSAIAVSGGTSPVSLSVSGLPSGVTGTLSSASVKPGSAATLTLSSTLAAAQGKFTVTVTGATAGGTTTSASIALTVTGSSIALAVSPASVSVAAGGSATATVTTSIATGVAQAVSLTVSNLPPGVTAQLSPSSVSAGGKATLTLTAAASATVGTSTITVTGNAPSGGAKTAALALTVTGNDFSVSASPAALSLAAGGSAATTLKTALVTGTAQTLALTAQGLPAGVTVSFTPANLQTGASSVATFAASKTATAGTWTVSLVATGASAQHAATVTLTIPAPPVTGGGIVNGGFESQLAGWTIGGTPALSTPGHSGTYALFQFSASPTITEATASQTFQVPTGVKQLSFWYLPTCFSSKGQGWATVTLTNNTAHVSTTPLPQTCTVGSKWINVVVPVTAGASYTLTLSSHDASGGLAPNFTQWDDVALQ